MESTEKIEKLRAMLALGKELASTNDPALDGDIQAILSIITNKLRYLDPISITEHITEYE